MSSSNICGWTAVVLGTLAAGFWAFWGTNEAFHEGWCKPLLWMRLLQVAAYLAPASVFAVLIFLGLRWPWVGAALCVLAGVALLALILIGNARFAPEIVFCLTALPILLGLMFLFGRPEPRKLAYTVALGIPALIVIGCAVEPVIRVSTRFDDGDRGMRLVEGRGVRLLWAPAGPGWSREGNVTWDDALDRVRYLTQDGMSLADQPQDIWRLPTREEIVCSLTRDGRNAGGTWDPEHEGASYERAPDKESPLWDPFAPLIYLWTSEKLDDKRAWIVVYNGGVYPKNRATGSPSFGFRAVREPIKEDE